MPETIGILTAAEIEPLRRRLRALEEALYEANLRWDRVVAEREALKRQLAAARAEIGALRAGGAGEGEARA
jgi:chromosome segregation ATPase